MKRIILLFGIFLMVAMLLACAPRVVSVQKAISPERAVEEPKAFGKESWQVEWEETLQQAKKEGKIIIYTSVSPITRTEITRVFQKRFEGIKLELVAGATGAELSQKIISQRRAGLDLADLYISGADTFINDLKPAKALDKFITVLILPQVLDPRVWWQGKLPFHDRDGMVFNFIASHGGYDTHGVNTEVIKPEEIKSWYDLLSPRFKDKIVMRDPAVPGKGSKQMITMATKSELGWDYYQELVKQRPVLTRNYRLQMEWIAQKKFLVAISPDEGTALEFKEAGVPIEVFGGLKESILWVAGSFGYIGILNRAPHPNAARIFANWLLDKEGQEVWGRTTVTQSARVDVDTEYLVKAGSPLRKTGVNYHIADDEEVLLRTPELREIIKEIFGPLLK